MEKNTADLSEKHNWRGEGGVSQTECEIYPQNQPDKLPYQEDHRRTTSTSSTLGNLKEVTSTYHEEANKSRKNNYLKKKPKKLSTLWLAEPAKVHPASPNGASVAYSTAQLSGDSLQSLFISTRFLSHDIH